MILRYLLWTFVLYYLLTGFWLAVAPHDFYLQAPGAAETGPYNMHFMRDVGFAFLTSAIGIGYGLYRSQRSAMVLGALWILVHGLFHLSLWVLHGLQLDGSALTDAVLVTLPAIGVFLLCCFADPIGGGPR